MDMHAEMIFDEYKELLPVLKLLKGVVDNIIRQEVTKSGVFTNSYSSRIKTEKSLEGKLELKGYKYKDIYDLTDILGARIVTYYSSDVDRVASVLEKTFNVDRENSIDRRKEYNIDQFGYMSLHYICSVPETLYKNEEYPNINKIRFEIQIRTSLQDAWAQITHDIGYKSDVEIPKKILRRLNRLAGLLEMADEEFNNIRQDSDQYRKGVKQIVSSGDFNEVELNIDTFNEYIEIDPFSELMRRIQSINSMDIQEVSLSPYYRFLKALGFKTLGDIEKMRKDNEEDAYQFALRLFGDTDLDIAASSVAIMCLCIVYLFKVGSGLAGLNIMLNSVNGERPSNMKVAQRYYKIGQAMGLVKQ
ncbi:MAG: (p)ppGpp synthetase [Bacilli bacterium]|nr:(p)ppGpp synthetase [Bacilli bacterium]MBO4682923.1 (p)ppGpp synthetase [Bacilli bacterium]